MYLMVQHVLLKIININWLWDDNNVDAVAKFGEAMSQLIYMSEIVIKLWVIATSFYL